MEKWRTSANNLLGLVKLHSQSTETCSSKVIVGQSGG